MTDVELTKLTAVAAMGVTALVAVKVMLSLERAASVTVESVTTEPLMLETVVPVVMLPGVVVSATTMPGKMPVAAPTVNDVEPLVAVPVVVFTTFAPVRFESAKVAPLSKPVPVTVTVWVDEPRTLGTRRPAEGATPVIVTADEAEFAV